jgi:preprotein translocase subunit SecE
MCQGQLLDHKPDLPAEYHRVSPCDWQDLGAPGALTDYQLKFFDMEKTEKNKKTGAADSASGRSGKDAGKAVSSPRKSSSQTKGSTPLDYVLWTVFVLGVVGSVGLNYYFSQPETLQPVTTRLPFVIGCIVIAAVCALCTSTGRRFIRFAKASRGELRKVTWPTKDETIKSTVGVAVVAVIVAFMLWVFDVIIGFLVNLITGA